MQAKDSLKNSNVGTQYHICAKQMAENQLFNRFGPASLEGGFFESIIIISLRSNFIFFNPVLWQSQSIQT